MFHKYGASSWIVVSYDGFQKLCSQLMLLDLLLTCSRLSSSEIQHALINVELVPSSQGCTKLSYFCVSDGGSRTWLLPTDLCRSWFVSGISLSPELILSAIHRVLWQEFGSITGEAKSSGLLFNEESRSSPFRC